MDTMSTPVPALENKSYFEKNKKMIILLIIMLLIFCGLISYIFISNRPSAPVVNNNGNQIVTPEPTTIVSSPVVVNQTPTPVTNPVPEPVKTKTLSFEMTTDSFGPDYVPHVNLIVPFNSSTLFPDPISSTSKVIVLNTDYKLTFYIPYEISGFAQYKSDVVKIGNAGGFQNVYRVNYNEDSNPLFNMYANNTTIETGSCYSEAIEKPEVQAPCGYPILRDPKLLEISCEVSNKANFTICDDIIKSMTIENVNK
ncbi:MAG: hypothetical protein ACMG57_03440 [Candidatus Dojkabacteria bacterium]